MDWPQDIAAWASKLGLTKYTFPFALMMTLLLLSIRLTDVAVLVLAVSIFFPVAFSLSVDTLHLAILTALFIEICNVIPPVGLKLFAVSGVMGIPITQVIRKWLPFCNPIP